MTRTGRRPGGGSSREEILAAARARFAADGYEAVSVRAVAREAGVDPALIHRFYGGKSELFAAAMQLPPAQLAAWNAAAADGIEGVGRRLALLFEHEWRDPATSGPRLAMLQAAVTRPEIATMLREFLASELLGPVARRLDGPDAQLRVMLVGSQLIGMAVARHVLRVEPLASLAEETVATLVGDLVQRTLTGPLPAVPGETAGAARDSTEASAPWEAVSPG